MRGRGILLFAALLVIGSSGDAAPIQYRESVDGDLSISVQDASNPILFDLGVNTITGTTSRLVVVPGLNENDSDDFSFRIPATALLSSITFEITSLTIVGSSLNDAMVNPLINLPSAAIAIPFPHLPAFVSGHQPIPIPATFDFTGALPLGEGVYRTTTTYSIGLGCQGGCPAEPNGYSIDYKFSFVVVPEPSSFALLVSSLVGLAARRTRSERNSEA